MKTFMSLSDLSNLADDDPARSVVKQLLEWLIADGEFPNHPYNPDDNGYIALVDPGDIDMPILTDITWEGASIVDGSRRSQSPYVWNPTNRSGSGSLHTS